MHLNILALDLDGTRARHGAVAEETWQSLRRAKEAEFVLLLVTGRRLTVIPEIMDQLLAGKIPQYHCHPQRRINLAHKRHLH